MLFFYERRVTYENEDVARKALEEIELSTEISNELCTTSDIFIYFSEYSMPHIYLNILILKLEQNLYFKLL